MVNYSILFYLLCMRFSLLLSLNISYIQLLLHVAYGCSSDVQKRTRYWKVLLPSCTFSENKCKNSLLLFLGLDFIMTRLKNSITAWKKRVEALEGSPEGIGGLSDVALKKLIALQQVLVCLNTHVNKVG